MKDAWRLEQIQVAAEKFEREKPTNRVAKDLIWLCQQLREAWKELEKRKLEQT